MRPGFAATAMLAAMLVTAPGRARAQSAYDQLQTACRQSGGNCAPSIPAPSAPTRVDQDQPRSGKAGPTTRAATPSTAAPAVPVLTSEQAARAQVSGMLLQGIISSIFDTGGGEEAGAAAQAAAAERLRAEAALLQQRVVQVQQQRTTRDEEDRRSLEDMAAALSDPWVGRAPSAGSEPVRLEGAGVVTPMAAPSNPLARPTPPSSAALASDRLARLAAENGDVAVLASRLSTLEERLAAVRKEAVGLKRDMKGASRELDAWGQQVSDAVEDARERGVSLAFEGLLTLQPRALARLGEVQSNSRAWNRMTDILRSSDRTARDVIDASQAAQDRLGDAQQLLARRDFKEDVTFLAQRLGGTYAMLGGSILSSAQNVKVELQGWKAIDKGTAEVAAGPARLARVKSDYADLLDDVKQARLAVSRATGIPARDLVRGAPEPERPGALGSSVPHPND